jgi:hypothetical protein
MKTMCVALFSFLALAACTKESDARGRDGTGTKGTGTGATGATLPDNTGINRRDRDGHTLTPLDQSNEQAHVELTARVRRAITEDEGLSANAKNVKVITTSDGTVTLRGPVKSQAEKDAVVGKARAAAGTANVVDQLEVENR